ncbi:hypothetical protein EKD04_000995 [Chloroflexales bacterium ZM16-3]|nr:hypothetical protein [Chloroflexales bacterium ZM16-3]
MPVLRPLARIWTALLALAALTLVLGLVVRWLFPVTPWIAAPTLDTNTPVDGAVDVLPRSEVVLSFSAPMNRAAARGAVRITPHTEGAFRWSDDARQLTFTPATTLEPDTDYTILVGGGALGSWWQPIAAPRQIRFRTAPLPAVVAALPSVPGAPIDGSLAIIFSQAMVPADQVDRPRALTQIQIDPPVSAQMRWIDQTTLLIRPDTPLRAATRYTATIAPELTDLRGVDLGRPFSWSWSTAWPEPLDRAPVNDARWVSPHQPLALTLSAPLDPALLRSALAINPPVEGEITTAQIDATQVVTFTPRLAWEYGRSYRVSLTSDNPDLVAPPDIGWSFSVEPEPGLIAFSPGQGQMIAAGQEVRLIFSTPMDEAALRAGLSIDPPVGDLSLEVSETEVRLRPNLQPSSTYTLTVAADTPDRSGEPLGVTATVRLQAAAAEPALRAPTATANVISLPISQTAQIVLERINLSRLDLTLYQLDTPTAVRAMGLAPDAWRDFSPERYGQSLARSWQLPLSDPADTPTRDPITVAIADDAPLPTGIYYLRVRSPEGPRADLLLQVSSLDLTLRQSDSQVLVWATDRTSGEPVSDVPLLLYTGESLITRGKTDAAGVWEQPIQRPQGGAPYLVLADGPAPALVRGDWLATPMDKASPRLGSLLFLDRLAYQPGDSVQVGGVARARDADGAMMLPIASTPCRMQLLAATPLTPSPSAACAISATGALSGTLRLSSRQPPGDYRLLVQVGDSTAELALRVADQVAQADLFFAEAGGQVTLRAMRSGLPLAGAMVSWTLDLEPLAISADPEGFHFSTESGLLGQFSGAGTTDDDGMLAIPLPMRDAAEGPLRYRLRAELRSGDDLLAVGLHDGQILPTDDRVGLRLASRIVMSNERATVDLLVLSADGTPASGRRVGLAVYHSGNVGSAPVIVRSATSDAQGYASAQLVQLPPGAYEIVASLGDSASSAGLWVVGGRYAGWQNAPGQVTLVADRDSYRPGDVARLLITSPYTQANLLLTTERGDLRSVAVRDLRPSQLITLTITPEMAPAISLGAVLASGGERLAGAATIGVVDGQPPLAVSVATDSRQYAPAGSAVLSVTTSLAGAPAAADLLVVVAPADSPAAALALAGLTPSPPPPLSTAMLQPGTQADLGGLPAPATLTGGEGYLVPIGVGAGGAGQMVLRVPLPNASGYWRVSAYAMAGTDRFAVAATVVTTSLPLDLTAEAPPLLRPGDRAEVSLLIRNTSPVTQSLKVRLQVAGGEIDLATPADRQLLLVPGGTQRLAWGVSPRPGVRVVNLRYTVDGTDLSELLSRDLTVEAVVPAAGQEITLVGSGNVTTTLPLAAPAEGDVVIVIAPGVWATLADSANSLAALSDRSVEQRAGLLMISAALARSAPVAGGEDWAAMARQAADDLAAAQNADGGWGWWPGTPSQPFISAFAVEAQQFAHGSVDGVAAPSPRALGYLASAGDNLDPNTRAYLLYVRSRAGAGDAAVANALISAELDADGLAYLAQTLPASAAASLLDRLLRVADRAPEEITWAADGPSAMPRSQATVSAAAVQSLRVVRPLAAERAAAERGLLTRWRGDGWPGAFAAARVAVALQNQTPATGGPLAVQLGAAVLLDRAEPITSTIRLQAPATAASEGVALQVIADGTTSYLVAARAVGQRPTGTADSPAQISLYQEYLDPLSGAQITPAELHEDQLVALQVTVISARPIVRGSLEIALPATLQPIDLEVHPPFIHANALDAATRSLRIEAADLSPGVYTVRVLARAVAVGEFVAPAARLLLDEVGLPPAVAPASPILTVSGR